MKAVFLDRDGVLNVDSGYTYKLESLQLIEGSAKAVKLLNDNGYLVFVVSNQSGIGRGYYTKEDCTAFNNKLKSVIYEISGGIIDKIRICPHKPEDHCKCRKPSTYHYRKLVNHYGIDCDKSFVVGDKVTDLIPGDKLGMVPILLGSSNKDYINSKDLLSAVENIILRR